METICFAIAIELDIICGILVLIKDMRRLYVTHYYLPMLYRKVAKYCDRYALYLHSGMDILSYCFLCLVQDAPALPLCGVFVATAIVLPGVKPLEYDVPLTPRCRISTAALYLRD